MKIDDFVSLNEYVAAPSASEMGFHDFLRFRVLLPILRDGLSIPFRLAHLGISKDVWDRVTESPESPAYKEYRNLIKTRNPASEALELGKFTLLYVYHAQIVDTEFKVWDGEPKVEIIPRAVRASTRAQRRPRTPSPPELSIQPLSTLMSNLMQTPSGPSRLRMPFTPEAPVTPFAKDDPPFVEPRGSPFRKGKPLINMYACLKGT